MGVASSLLLSVFLSLFVFCLLLFVPPSGGPGPAPLPWLGGVCLAVCRSAWRCPAVRLGGLTWGVGLGLGGSGDPRSAVRGGRSRARALAYMVLLWWLRPARSVRLAPAPSRIVRCPSVSPWRSGSSAVRRRFCCRADLGAVAPSPSVCRPSAVARFAVLDAVSGSVWRSSVSVRSGRSVFRAYRIGGSAVWSAVRLALSLCGSAVCRGGSPWIVRQGAPLRVWRGSAGRVDRGSGRACSASFRLVSTF